jgi:poly-beta-1,6-N-acetyl-D-glucosamine synthase
MTKLVFWVSAGFVFYVYLGYPIVVWVLQRCFPYRVRRGPIQPFVSLVVPAYNEAHVIERKIRSILALDYPSERLEIVVVSDGSTDSTVEIVESVIARAGGERFRLFAFPENRGKVAALNATLPFLRGDIVVFSDAASMLATDSVRQLVANFADPRIGAASGVYRVYNHDSSRVGGQEDFYWRYETFLKQQEANLGCLLGAHGSLFAIRRELYCFPSERVINDDFVIPSAVVRRGYAIAYEPGAVAYEEAREMDGFTRRVRITAGNIEQLAALRELLYPLHPMVIFCFLSHKAARLVVPIAMVTLVVTNALLWRQPLYAAIAIAQLLFYCLAGVGALTSLRPPVLGLPYYFCKLNSAFFAWLYHGLRLGRPLPTRRELDGLDQQQTLTHP